MAFNAALQAVMQHQRSTLCLGLDPVLERLPAGIARSAAGVLHFNRTLIEATSDLVCAYKPNSAFYEALGSAGWDVLKQTIAAVPSHIPVILDAKRGDIGSTAQAYAYAAFEELGASAVTINPFLGPDSLEPFLAHPDRGCILLCRTSNPGGSLLQSLLVNQDQPLYQYIAQLAQTEWNTHENCGLVVGATHPTELQAVREIAPDLPLLIPGIGAQGGDVQTVLHIAGTHGIINVSRAILYADSSTQWLDAARTQAHSYRQASQFMFNHS